MAAVRRLLGRDVGLGLRSDASRSRQRSYLLQPHRRHPDGIRLDHPPAGRFFPEPGRASARGPRRIAMAILLTPTLASSPVPIRRYVTRPPTTGAHGRRRTWRSAPARTAGSLRDPRSGWLFARIVTHYSRHNCWMDGVDLIGGASKLAAYQRCSSTRLDVSGHLISPGSLVSVARSNSSSSTTAGHARASRA